jgi:hypothetical protein
MIISKELTEIGIDEEMIKILRSKTKLKDLEIESAELIISSDNKLLARLRLKNLKGADKRQFSPRVREIVIDINKSRIRELKLNKIFN